MANKYPEHQTPTAWFHHIRRAVVAMEKAEAALEGIHEEDQPIADNGAIIQQWIAGARAALAAHLPEQR